MGSILSKSRNSNKVYAIPPPPSGDTCNSVARPAAAIDVLPLASQSEELPETDAQHELRETLESGSAAELEAVLSRRQPSLKQLREEPFCSMMYRAARAGHVKVMAKVCHLCSLLCRLRKRSLGLTGCEVPPFLFSIFTLISGLTVKGCREN